jgi:hypothetical protein
MKPNYTYRRETGKLETARAKILEREQSPLKLETHRSKILTSWQQKSPAAPTHTSIHPRHPAASTCHKNSTTILIPQ